MSFFRSFVRTYRIVVLIIVAVIVAGSVISATIVVFKLKSLAQTNTEPGIHFAQLPWKADSQWTYQTGPHNFADGVDRHNGLDFVAPSGADKTVVAIAGGTIIHKDNGQHQCDNSSCANNGTDVWESISGSDGNTYCIEYYHLAFFSNANDLQAYTLRLSYGKIDAGQPIGIEGGTGFSVPAGFPHLWIGIYDQACGKGHEHSLSSASHSCSSVYFGNWRVCNGALPSDGWLHWTGFPTFDSGDHNTPYDRYASNNTDGTSSSCGNNSSFGPCSVLNVPSSPQPQPPTAQTGGLVYDTTSNGVPVYLQPSNINVSTCHQRTSLSQGEHVVVLNNTQMEDPVGHIYYWVAYPDHCERNDFSSLLELYKNETGAIGWVSANLLGTTNGVSAKLPSAQWRPCWEPSKCGSVPYNQSLGDISQWTLSLPSADSNLYAWWDGSEWDPHWFHVLKPRTSRVGAAVYGQDWQAISIPACIANVMSVQPSIAQTYELADMTDPCHPTSTPTPPTSQDNSLTVSNPQPVTVQPGQLFTVNFTFANNGKSTWSDADHYGLSCDTYYHNDSNCMGGSTVGFYGQQVQPGQQITFTVTLTAPSSPGAYTSWWDMQHNGSIFGNNNSNVQVKVQTGQQPGPTVTPSQLPVDNSQWISNSSKLTIQPGQQFTMQFTYLNDGTTTWSDANGYALRCDTYYHSNSNCMGGSPVGLGGQSIIRGQQITFTVSLVAPSSPGTYTTWWDMTHNGSIFGNNNSYVQVTVAAPPPTPKWNPILQQSAPDCNNPGGTVWGGVLQGTLLSCGNGGLLMQQTSSSYYAEVDLDNVNGGYYNQSTFRVQVQATFQNSSDTSTWAALLVQTPISGAGGFIFVLNPAGQWQLQQVLTGSNIPVVASGSIGINPSQPTTMTVVVQNGILYGYINGQQVVSWGDSLNPSPGVVSLMVQRPHAAPSSTILYTNFELDMWG